MSAEHVRVGLVGCGRAGMVHARNLAERVPDTSLVAVADADAATRQQAGEQIGGRLQQYEDADELLRDGEVDAIVVATPTFLHADIVCAALEQGTHVLSEKPLAATPEDGLRIAAAAEASDAVFMLAFMRRFDAGFRRVAERIAAGEIGEPLLVRSTGRGPGLPPPWAWDVPRSGGLAAEVNSHDIDTVRWLSGQEIVRVHAVGRAAKRPDIVEDHPAFVDVLAATFELQGGAIAQVDGACPADYGYDARVEVYGTEGVVFAGDPLVGRELLVRADGAQADPVRSWRDVFATAYRDEDEHFVRCAQGRADPVADHVDGLRALEVVLAVNASIAGGQPVEVEHLSPVEDRG